MRSMMIVTLIFVIAAAAGCDQTDPLEKDEDFILAIMALDTDGRSLAGYSISRLNSLDGHSPPVKRPARAAAPDSQGIVYPNPFSGSTTFDFSTADVREVLLEVLDWKGRHIRTIMDSRVPAGFHSVQWDGKDGTGMPTMNGVYYIRLYLADTLDVHQLEHVGISACTLFDAGEIYRTEGIGTTDATGFFSTRDHDYFPSLQGHGPQDAFNESREPLGTFSFSDTVTIRVSTPLPAEGGWRYHMSRNIVLLDEPRYLEFHFVPDDSTEVSMPAR
jgi:hypothetical protein